MRRNRKEVLETSSEFCVPDSLRDTPEKRLLCAIIERAIRDALDPSYEDPQRPKSQKTIYWEKVTDECIKSGIPAYTYARRIGCNPERLSYYVKKKREGREKKYLMSGFEYIFEDKRDASEEWSFDWVLDSIYPDAEAAKSYIRRLVKKFKNDLV